VPVTKARQKNYADGEKAATVTAPGASVGVSGLAYRYWRIDVDLNSGWENTAAVPFHAVAPMVFRVSCTPQRSYPTGRQERPLHFPKLNFEIKLRW
jgi:hypothetical protein